MLARLGHHFFRIRNFLFPVALLLVFVPGPSIYDDRMDALLAGGLLVIAGGLVRVLTIGLDYIIRGGRNRRVYAEDLVTTGIYAHTRNPMYIGNLLILAGTALASNSWLCFAVAVPAFCFIYAAIVAAEEQFLRAKFGAGFEAYARDVPRWGVRFRGLGTTLAGSHFHWRRVLIKEYGTITAWLAGISLLGFYHTQRTDDEPAVIAPLLLLTVAVAAVFWLVARWLKKSRRIVAD
jgi:protein-S-isoprenylcysteine O-methyltransferase Ste14